MASWDWRSFVLLVFIGVILIVAFSDMISHQSPIPPTELPPLTLVFRTMTESPPLTMALPIVLTLVEDSPTIPTYHPLSPTYDLFLDINPPNCYEMPHDGIQCLGTVYNPYDEALEKVSLEALLWDQNAELIDRTAFTLPQKYIPPYSIAPYEVIFSRDQIRSDDFGGVIVNFVHAKQTPFVSPPTAFHDVSVEWDHHIYKLLGTIEHDLMPLTALRLVVSLIDDAEQLMAFRVIELDSLESPEHPIQIDLIPLLKDVVLGHVVYLEVIETDE